MNSPSRAQVTVGAVVAETYKLEALIGRGGMGDVFSASHLRLPGKHVAIKFLHPDVADGDVLARFRREAEIASRLGHPNIVTVLDFNNLPDGTPYLVLEFLIGETLADALARGPFSVERTLSIARQLGSALAAAHRAGVVHRDLKPQNIFLVPTEIDGHLGEVAKILDFGISKIRGSQTVKTQDSALLGTPQYMAPEQATGQHDAVDGRTDIFALGAILYEMLSAQSAFAGASIPEVVFKVVYEAPPPLAQLVSGVPMEVIAAIERAMAKKPDERFATVGELVTALTGVGLATLSHSATGAPDFQGGARSDSRLGSAPRSVGRKVDSAVAMAKTMGSGDHGQAMDATAYQRPHGAATTPSPQTPSQVMVGPSGPPGPASMMGPPSSLAASPGVPSNAHWKWIVTALSALLAAAIAFVVLRPARGTTTPPTTGPSKPTRVAAVVPDAAPIPMRDAAGIATAVVDAPTAPPAPVDAGVATDAAGTAPDAPIKRPHGGDSTTKPPKPPGTPPPPPPPGDDVAPGELATVLIEAWQAAESGRDQVAKKLANSVLDTPGAPGKARSQANQIILLIACRADDRETAVRAARGTRVVRPKIVKECAAHDITLPGRGR